jgi:hypothetical protein
LSLPLEAEGILTLRITSGAQWSLSVSQFDIVGRASMSNSFHVVKSAEVATWTRLPFPLLPKAYHLLSAACKKLGSGKSVFSPNQEPFARFWNKGEARTAGSRDVISTTLVKGDVIRDMGRLFMKKFLKKIGTIKLLV